MEDDDLEVMRNSVTVVTAVDISSTWKLVQGNGQIGIGTNGPIAENAEGIYAYEVKYEVSIK